MPISSSLLAFKMFKPIGCSSVFSVKVDCVFDSVFGNGVKYIIGKIAVRVNNSYTKALLNVLANAVIKQRGFASPAFANNVNVACHELRAAGLRAFVVQTRCLYQTVSRFACISRGEACFS